MDIRPLIARAARTSVARFGAAQVDLDIAWKEWQVAAQARLLVVRLGFVRTELALARAEVAFQGQTEQVLEGAVHSGDATIDQLGVQRASLETVRNTEQQLARTESTTESDLLALLGEPGRAGIHTADMERWLAAASPLPPAGGLEHRCLARRLDLRALRQGYRAEDARLRQATLSQFPDLSIGVVQQRNESNVYFLGGAVTLGLPLFNRNQGQVALARATRTRLRDTYEARVVSLRSDLRRFYRLALLIEQQLPAVRDAITALSSIEVRERDAVARGDIDRLSYQAVRNALFEQKLQQASLEQALAEARVGLEAACGGPLGGGGGS